MAGRLVVESTGGEQVGAEKTLADLGDIKDVVLDDDYPNAGHFTAIRQGQRWIISFDFRYNSERVARHVSVAQQFHSVAASAIAAGHLNAAIENLYACVELIAKSHLLMSPDARLLRKTRHRFVETQFNQYGRHGNVPEEFVRLFNELKRVRNAARFPQDPLTVDLSAVQGWFDVASEMLSDIESRRPRRVEDL